MARHETITVSNLMIICALVPVVVITFFGFAVHRIHKNCRAMLPFFLHQFIAFFFMLAVTVFCTGVLKLLVGRLRPDFLDRCQPNYNQTGACRVCVRPCAHVCVFSTIFALSHSFDERNGI
jgi:diacylglycerol diphosphate phosphatase/phosphatidate phosphatase